MSKLNNYELETTFNDRSVTHTTYLTDLESNHRKTAVETTWRFKKFLGSGASGTVTLEESVGGNQLRAVKGLKKGKLRIDIELKVMSKIAAHPELFVVLNGWYHNNDYYYIAMEYIKGGDLSQYIQGTVSDRRHKNAPEITRQLLEGLIILHGMKICHRDIKPQNILIASTEPIWVKISDFGVSKRFKDSQLRTQVGTHVYMAPELLGMLPGEDTYGTYTEAVDIWSLGCVVYEVLTAEIPFLERNSTWTSADTQSQPQKDYRAFRDFCVGKTEFPIDRLQRSKVSEPAVQFMKGVLVSNPSSRPRANELIRSEWINQGGEYVKAPAQLAIQGSSAALTGLTTRDAHQTSDTLSFDSSRSSTLGFRSPDPCEDYLEIQDARKLESIPDRACLASKLHDLSGGHGNRRRRVESTVPGREYSTQNSPRFHTERPHSTISRFYRSSSSVHRTTTAASAESGQTPRQSMSESIKEYRPLPITLKTFRSRMRAATLAKQEWKVRLLLNLSSTYIAILIKLGTEAALSNLVNVGMLVLRDAVENQFAPGTRLITATWAKALLRAMRNGHTIQVESELKLCVEDAKRLCLDDRVPDARNLIIAGLDLFVEVCQAGDHDLMELIAGIWAKTQDDQTLIVEIRVILEIYCDRWATAVSEKNVQDARALTKAGIAVWLASGRIGSKGLTVDLGTFFLSSVQQVLNPSNPDVQDWAVTNMSGQEIANAAIGRHDEELAQVAVEVGVEFSLAMTGRDLGNQYSLLRVQLLGRSITVLEKIVAAGHLESAKTTFENLSERKFRQCNRVRDRDRKELEANLLRLLRGVSDAGYNIPGLQAAINDLEERIKVLAGTVFRN